ncbi:MAG: response regulator [Cellvibrionaceae bacterium]
MNNPVFPESNTRAQVTGGHDTNMQNAIVLVVDDSPEALSLINDALEPFGISVLVALEGKQALTIAKRLRPDMILMDAIMPTMDGFEACSLLKQDPELANIPVIFMTGLTDTDNIVRGLEAGGVDYLTKPISPAELLARMKVHLSNARLANSAQQALDATGQNLLTVNQLGQLQWATPQTYALFAKADADDRWQTQQLPMQLIPLLQAGTTPQPGQTVNANGATPLQQLDYPLEVKLIEARSDTEFLLKLIDAQREPEDIQLQNALQLTAREAEVLLWIANGKTNREIAEILCISPRTINKHLEQLFPKLGVENRTAAAAKALRILNQAE